MLHKTPFPLVTRWTRQNQSLNIDGSRGDFKIRSLLDQLTHKHDHFVRTCKLERACCQQVLSTIVAGNHIFFIQQPQLFCSISLRCNMTRHKPSNVGKCRLDKQDCSVHVFIARLKLTARTARQCSSSDTGQTVIWICPKSHWHSSVYFIFLMRACIPAWSA